MACVVLLSTTGFGLVEHTCQMRGKKKTMVVAFSEAKTGPGCESGKTPMPAHQTVVDKTQCCADNHLYENVDVSSSLSQLAAKFIKTLSESFVAGAAVVVAWLVDWVFVDESASVSIAPSFPSPSGRDILTFVQSLLI